MGLEVIGVDGHLNVLECAAETEQGKPYPDPLLLAAQKLGVKPEDCLVFEDDYAGVQAAESANMKWIRVVKIKIFGFSGLQGRKAMGAENLPGKGARLSSTILYSSKIPLRSFLLMNCKRGGSGDQIPPGKLEIKSWKTLRLLLVKITLTRFCFY